MDKELKVIHIFTARFVEFKTEYNNEKVEEKAILDVLVGVGVIQRRSFDRILIENIKNPRNIIIGIAVWPGTQLNTFIDGNRYWKLFEKSGWPTPYEIKVNTKRYRKLKKILK